MKYIINIKLKTLVHFYLFYVACWTLPSGVAKFMSLKFRVGKYFRKFFEAELVNVPQLE